MDQTPRPAHPDSGRLHVHVGPALPGDALGADGRLDAAHQVGAAARRRRLRVPGLHAARPLVLRHAACSRAVSTDPGRAGPARGHGLHHQPHVPHPVQPRAARLHLLVPRGRGERTQSDLVRLVARRRVRGDGEGRGHHVVPAGAGRRARRLRPLLVLALQRRGRLCQGARAQRRAAGGDADGVGGAVEQRRRDRGAAGGGGAARAAAARTARQLIARAAAPPRDCAVTVSNCRRVSRRAFFFTYYFTAKT
ncbi:uncharacterized protein LOC142984925 isoform X3 [Anticarsia gemmatalis]|uniref:uncharacterized protein LOC142984925 isoform X3 n=1 Tax=Anticarsia gemmatalis TaxID=129554 RepID=UPI003F75BBE5